jgi:hypothetical protein
MKRYLTWALGCLPLAWLAGPAAAQQWYPVAAYPQYPCYPQSMAGSTGGFPLWGTACPNPYPMPYGTAYPAARPMVGPAPSYGITYQAYPVMPQQTVPQADAKAVAPASPGAPPQLQMTSTAAAPMPSASGAGAQASDQAPCLETMPCPCLDEELPPCPPTCRRAKKACGDKAEANPCPPVDDPLGWNRCLGQPGAAEACGVDMNSPAPHWGHLVGGGSLYLLQPYFGNNLAFTKTRLSTTTVTNPVTGLPSSVVTGNQQIASDLNYDFSASPNVWFGLVTDCGIGVQGRFFRFDQLSHALNESLSSAEASGTGAFAPPAGTVTTVSIAAPATITSLLPGGGFAGSAPSAVSAADTSGLGGDDLDFTSRLKIELADLEATYDAQVGHLGLQIACGGRYLHMAQNFKETLSGKGVPAGGTLFATETEQLDFGHNFRGGGPTLGLQAHWQLGESSLAIVGSARGALLIGKTRVTALFTDEITDLNGILTPSALSSTYDREKDMVLPIAEVEVGLEYAPQCYSCRPFFRVAAINQTYFDAGSATSLDGNLGLFGVDFSLGVEY